MNSRTTRTMERRKGFMAPAVAVALVVVLGAVALVLDRLWLDMAHLELMIAAESSALAAARELACDDRLRVPHSSEDHSSEDIVTRAREMARITAITNRAVGTPVELETDLDGDVRIGRFVLDPISGQDTFEETDDDPNSVLVHASRTRSRGNPVALFLRGLTHQPAGDVVAIAGARIDNHVIGVRPWSTLTVPAFPLAILASDPTGKRRDTWAEQIEQRKGMDQFGIDPLTGDLLAGSDGIPEIVLNTGNPGDKPDKFNLTVVKLHPNQAPQDTIDQISRGWNKADLSAGDGAFKLSPAGVSLSAVGVLSRSEAEELTLHAGQCRICLLYKEFGGTDAQTPCGVEITGLVAGRVLQVNRGAGMAHQIVFQPGIVVTRTALLPHEFADQNAGTTGPENPYKSLYADSVDQVVVPPNRYLYKLMLTH